MSNHDNNIKEKITEQPSRFDHLEQMSVSELLQHINEEDCRVAEAVQRAIPQIEALVVAIEERMKQGGRLFYIGAGTSGRLGVLDASELPPTFGVPANKVMGIIAGGDKALRKAVEKAEDITEQGWKDLQAHEPTANDTVLGIAAASQLSSVGLFEAAWLGVYQCYYWTVFSLKSLGQSFTHKKAPDLAGPIGIVNIIHKSVHTGIENFVFGPDFGNAVAIYIRNEDVR